MATLPHVGRPLVSRAQGSGVTLSRGLGHLLFPQHPALQAIGLALVPPVLRCLSPMRGLAGLGPSQVPLLVPGGEFAMRSLPPDLAEELDWLVGQPSISVTYPY